MIPRFPVGSQFLAGSQMLGVESLYFFVGPMLFLASFFLKIVAPMGADLDKLEKWHHSLMMIKNFSDLYAKALIYFLISICVIYLSILYVLTIVSFEEIKVIFADWFWL